MLLPAILANSSQPPCTLLLLQSSIAQSCIPIIRAIIKKSKAFKGRTVLFCSLYPPTSLVEEIVPTGGNLDILDHTGSIPGYGDSQADARERIIAAMKTGERADRASRRRC